MQPLPFPIILLSIIAVLIPGSIDSYLYQTVAARRPSLNRLFSPQYDIMTQQISSSQLSVVGDSDSQDSGERDDFTDDGDYVGESDDDNGDGLEAMIQRAAMELSEQKAANLDIVRAQRQAAKKAKADREYEQYWAKIETGISSSSTSSRNANSKKVDPKLKSFAKSRALQREYYTKKSFISKSEADSSSPKIINGAKTSFTSPTTGFEFERSPVQAAEGKGKALLTITFLSLAVIGISTLASLSL